MTNDFEFEVTGGKAAVKRYTGSGGDVVIPACTPDGVEVTALGKGAFFNCIGVTAVIIPDGVVTIGEEAFFGCGGLRSMTIPDSVIVIGKRAFGDPWEERAFGHLWKLTVTVSRDSYARTYCEQESLNIRYPGEEKVRPCLADDPRAYCKYVFHRFEVFDEADSAYTVWSVRFLELRREPDGKLGPAYLGNENFSLRISETDLKDPCPDVRKRVEEYFQGFCAFHEGWNDWPAYETNLLDELTKVNASVYEAPDSVRSDRLGDFDDALLIRAAGLWYYMEYTESDKDDW